MILKNLKIQLAIAINLIFFKDNDEKRVMHSKSNNIEIMINNKTNEVIKDLLQSLLSKYLNIKGSELVFDCVHLLYYKCHKINPDRGGSYIDFPDWIKNKKSTINPITKKDNKCFQYTITVALNPEKIKENAEKITKIKHFISNYNWEEINYLSEKDDWNNFEKNSLAIAFNVLYAKNDII